jgi:cytidyltransferase-like protein
MGKIEHFVDLTLTEQEMKDFLGDVQVKKIKFYEKLDGQNLKFTITSSKEILFARSRQDVLQGGIKYIDFKSKWGANVKWLSQLLWAYSIIEENFLQLQSSTIKSIFKNGVVFLDCELVNKDFINIFSYKEDKIVIHLLDCPEETVQVLKSCKFGKEVTLDREIYINLNKFSDKIPDSINQLQDWILDSASNFSEITNYDSIWERYEQSSAELVESVDQRVKDKVIHSANKLKATRIEIYPFEGVVFRYQDKIYKMTGNFSCYNTVINLTKTLSNKKICIVPGSFKPPHKGHLEMVKHYSQNFDIVIVLVSLKTRSCETLEITSEQSREIFNFYLETFKIKNVEIRTSKEASPFKEALDLYEKLTQNGNTVFIGRSNKGQDAEEVEKLKDKIKFDFYEISDNISSRDFREALYRKKGVWDFLPEGLPYIPTCLTEHTNKNIKKDYPLPIFMI